MVFHGPELRVGALACGQAVHMGAGRASGLDALATPGPPAQLCPGPALLPHLRGGGSIRTSLPGTLHSPGFTLLRASRRLTPQHRGPLGRCLALVPAANVGMALPCVFGALWEGGRAARTQLGLLPALARDVAVPQSSRAREQGPSGLDRTVARLPGRLGTKVSAPGPGPGPGGAGRPAGRRVPWCPRALPTRTW